MKEFWLHSDLNKIRMIRSLFPPGSFHPGITSALGDAATALKTAKALRGSLGAEGSSGTPRDTIRGSIRDSFREVRGSLKERMDY